MGKYEVLTGYLDNCLILVISDGKKGREGGRMKGRQERRQEGRKARGGCPAEAQLDWRDLGEDRLGDPPQSQDSPSRGCLHSLSPKGSELLLGATPGGPVSHRDSFCFLPG